MLMLRVIRIVKILLNIILILDIIVLTTASSTECIRRQAPYENYICVCNSTYCDFPEPLPDLKSLQYAIYTTSKLGDRMKLTTKNLCPTNNTNNFDMIIDRTKKYQKIMAFGGALTDSTGINIAALPKPAQDLLMQSYFSDKGNRYNLLRIPIGGTDFSVKAYTYDDTEDDTTLSHFQLHEEDLKYKIPYIKKAKKLSPDLILMSCPWTAPPWMKTNKDYHGGGSLRKEYYQVWADYYIKFLQAYQQRGVNFTIVSGQNEPVLATSPNYLIPGMSWTPENQGKWIVKHLGPTLKKNGFNDTEILIGDDQRLFMQYWVSTIAKNKEAMKYVSGVGIHWYLDEISFTSILDDIHKTPNFENRWMLYSESCEGSNHYHEGVVLGDWSRAETYFQNIVDVLNNWVVGWTDWNLVLNMTGGPTYTTNIVDAPILVDATKEEFYKQPMFYAIGHASRFLPRNSVRLDLQDNNNMVSATAFETPNNQTVILLLNTHDEDAPLKILDKERKTMMQFTMEARTLKTIIY